MRLPLNQRFLIRPETAARTAQFCISIFVFFWSYSPVFGKDLNELTKILTPAFSAQQMSAICTSAQVPFSDDDKALFTSAQVYADGIKQIIIAGLSDSDVSFVLRSAADQSKAATRAELAALAKYPAQQLPARHFDGAKIR